VVDESTMELPSSPGLCHFSCFPYKQRSSSMAGSERKCLYSYHNRAMQIVADLLPGGRLSRLQKQTGPNRKDRCPTENCLFIFKIHLIGEQNSPACLITLKYTIRISSVLSDLSSLKSNLT